MAVGLGWVGFGSLGQGVWICPWVDRETEATLVLATAGVADATMFRSTMTNVGDPSTLAERAWGHDEISAEYARFIDRFTVTNNPEVKALIDLVHEWRRFPLLDPGLPTELLGKEWVGGTAAQLFSHTRGRLRKPSITLSLIHI